MRKFLFILSCLLFLSLSTRAFATQIFITTIQNVTVEQFQDVALDYMTSKNFALDRVENHTITFTKGFGDGFWIASRNMIIKFNTLPRDGNLKLVVTQMEDSPQISRKGQRSIEHLIPLIKEIRHRIDGTPIDQIQNESAKESDSGAEQKN